LLVSQGTIQQERVLESACTNFAYAAQGKPPEFHGQC
jgi:hypothetical protein